MKFKDLESGMLLTRGIVVKVGQPNTSKFFGDSAYIDMLDIEDAYYGQTSRAIDDEHEEFTILAHRGSEEFKNIVNRLITERQDFMKEAKQDITFLRGL